MKTSLRLALALIALATAGCGQKDTSSTAAAASAAPQSGPRTVEITAGDNMKFNLTSIEARPGEEIKVILTNIGTQPKEVMGHNWILLKGGVDATAFSVAAAADKAAEYFPAAKAGDVLAHIPLLGPRKSGEVTFKAPAQPGEYVFLCSFPAHFQVGMKGVLVVK
jgi:azurin